PKHQHDPSRRRFLRTTGLLAGALTLGVTATGSGAAKGGVETANGWYEEEEIYYLAQGVEEGVTERGENDIYLIGGDRLYQAQVVEFIPGEPGYSPHWNVNVVHTAMGVTTSDIAGSKYASHRFDEATNQGPLFDDLADILGAENAGLVTIAKPGVVVLCPIVPERVADAPGNTELPEDFPAFPETF
ncbi:MAG: hypothetical protein R3324_20275, partial [Halobacteriales archaeon]|nr:hypothetical protein [Halobacteriales archaeon]